MTDRPGRGLTVEVRQRNMSAMANVVLLGPQRRLPGVASAVARLGITDRVCAITAGWQERADEIADLQNHLKIPIVRLDLYRRAESVFESDREFFDAYRGRQDELRIQQQVYRTRLNSLMKQCLEVWDLPASFAGRERERSHALEMVRELDRHHLAMVNTLHREFDRKWRPLARPEIRRHRREIKGLIESSQGILVAGGHVAVLLNRLRIFGLKPLLSDHPIVAWSGGAMVLAQRLILFHDSPPQGKGFAEILEAGLGLYSRVQPFPDAGIRLQLENPVRLEILARRFHPQSCLLLDPGTQACREDDRWVYECPTIDLKGNLHPCARPEQE